jgi:hypothetical protein
MIAIIYVLNSIHLYKLKDHEHSEVAHWILLTLSIVQALLHGFKASSFHRGTSQGNAVIERVIHDHDIKYGTNLDRVFQLNERPRNTVSAMTIFSSLAFHLSICAINLTTILNFEGLGPYKMPIILPFKQISTLIPFDLSLISMFMIFHLAYTEYIGRCDIDKYQYLAIRILPFATLFIDQLSITSEKASPLIYKSGLLLITALQLLYLIMIDFERCIMNPLDIMPEDDYESDGM